MMSVLEPSLKRLVRSSRLLLRERRGVALLEFGFTAPLVLVLGMYGIEMANLAVVNMKVSQIALNLADNAARVGIMNESQIEQMREVDMNDVLQAARKQGEGLKLTTFGRVIVSSLEADGDGNQVIHWQRCIGLKNGADYDSSYGITATTNQSTGKTYDPTAGVNTATLPNDNSDTHPGSKAIGKAGGPSLIGMGDTAADAVKAPPNSGVIFVEINYLYQPVVGSWVISPTRVHYIASFIVRDNRDFTQIYNPSPAATRATCDLYTA